MRRTISVLAALAIAVALTLTVPFEATAAPIHVQHPCVKVRAKVRPRHARVGDDIWARASYRGCGERSVYVQYRFVFTGPCIDGFRDHHHARVSRDVKVTVLTPTFPACAGTYRVTAEAYHDGRLVDRMSRRIHVRP